MIYVPPYPPLVYQENWASGTIVLGAGVAANVASLTLPAGTWSLNGRATVLQGIAVGLLTLGISPTNASFVSGYAASGNFASLVSQDCQIEVNKVIVLTVSTIVYLVILDSTAGTVQNTISGINNVSGLSATRIS